MSSIHRITVIFYLIIAFYTQATAFAFCTKYTHYADAELETYFSILQNLNKSEFERITAYEKIACSDNPIYRQLALKVGFEDTSNSILRSKILMDAIMDKDIFVIDLIETSSLGQNSKEFIKYYNSQIRIEACKRNPVQGSVSLHRSPYKCGGNRQITVKGKYVEVMYDDIYGKFELTHSNNLEGYVISGNPKTEKISAKLNLF